MRNFAYQPTEMRSIDFEQIAMDAKSKYSQDAINSEAYDMYLLQKTNRVPNGGAEKPSKDGFGVRLRAADQQSTPLIITNSQREHFNAFASVARQYGVSDQAIAMDDTSQFNIPSEGVLQYYTTVFNNKLIKQVLKTTPSREMTADWQQGQFGTTNLFVPTVAYGGYSEVYTNTAGTGGSSVNYNWVPRQAITLQRTIMYGDMTMAQFSMAKINYVGDLREGVAALANLDINQINFTGFSQPYMKIFGLLNDPSLNATIPAPMSIANPSSGQWTYKDYFEIVADITSLFTSMIEIAGGNLDFTSECIFGLPPTCYTALTKQNNYGITVEGYCKTVFPGMRFIQVPQYQGTGSPVGSDVPNYCQLIFKKVGSQEVAYNLFSTLYNSHGVVRMVSSYEEKISYTISGAFIALAFGISTMSGI